MADQLIFISGATGFIGSQTARSFIGKLNDVDNIFQLASPMPEKGADLHRNYVERAVSGTTAILEAASGPEKLKFIIVMSSILAPIPVGAMAKPPVHSKVLVNSDERTQVDLNQPFPSGAAGYGAKYSASKILAHHATQDFVQREKPKFKLIAFHPGFVLGDSLVQKTADDIDGMDAMFWQSLQFKTLMIPSAFVHAQDIADAHVTAVENYPGGTGARLGQCNEDRERRLPSDRDFTGQGTFMLGWLAD